MLGYILYTFQGDGLIRTQSISSLSNMVSSFIIIIIIIMIIIIIIGIYIAPFPFIKCSKALHIVIV